MHTFRTGDKVRCVNDKDMTRHLTRGKEYTVLSCCSKWVDLESDSRSFFADRFELVTEPKVNQWQAHDKNFTLPYKAETHTMPDGVVMWRIPESVTKNETMRFSVAWCPSTKSAYIYDDGDGNESNDHELKGKTKDGKPFGVWTVDFGGDT